MLLDVFANLIGAMFAALFFVNILMAAAGVRFSSSRQICVAYFAFWIASIFISAVGHADAGPPNFNFSGAYLLGAVGGALVQLAFLMRSNAIRPASRRDGSI